MAISGTYDDTTTATELISSALSLINAHDEEETIPAEMWVYCLRQLNKLMRFLSMHKGLWLVEDVEITLTPGTTSYSIAAGGSIANPGPMRIIHARRSESVDVPIEIISAADYYDIPNKTLQAPVNVIYHKLGRTTGTVYVWPTGTSTDNTIKLLCQRPIQDFNDEGNNPDFPTEWTLPVEYNLAAMIAPKYLGGVVPPDIKEMARDMLATVLTYDEETADINLQPM